MNLSSSFGSTKLYEVAKLTKLGSLEGPCFGTGVFSGMVAMETEGKEATLLGISTKGIHNVIN